VELKADFGVLGDEAGAQLGDRPQGLGGDRDTAPCETGGVLELTASLVEMIENLVDASQERGTETVEPYPPALAVEERDVQLALQTGDRTAERGLGDVELGGRPAYVFVTGHSLEVAQLEQVHDTEAYIASYISTCRYWS